MNYINKIDNEKLKNELEFFIMVIYSEIKLEILNNINYSLIIIIYFYKFSNYLKYIFN